MPDLPTGTVTFQFSDIEASVRLRAARLAVAVIFFVNGAVVATWAARIPAVQKALALTPGELGVALLGAAAGALAAMNLAGYLAARAGSRPVTVVAAFCLCTVFPLLALAPNLPLLLGALVLYGAANGSMDVAMNTQGVTVERGYKRPILTSFHALFSFGGLAGAFVGGVAAAHRIAPLPHFLGTAALAALAIVAVSRFLLPARADAGGAAVAFARPTRGLLALGLVAFCVVLGEGAMADWSAVYLAGTVRAGAGLAAAGYAAFSLLMALGRLGGDRLAARLGSARVLVPRRSYGRNTTSRWPSGYAGSTTSSSGDATWGNARAPSNSEWKRWRMWHAWCPT